MGNKQTIPKWIRALSRTPMPAKQSVQRKWTATAEYHNQKKETEHDRGFTMILYWEKSLRSVHSKIGYGHFAAG